MRAQTTLPAVGIAFLVLTAGLVVGIVAAETALRGADRQALDRKAAVGVSDALVREDAPVTERANVINGSALSELTATDLRNRYGLPADASVRITLDGRTVVSEGDPSGGVTVERIVLDESRENVTITDALDGTRVVALPRRTPGVRLTLRPPPTTNLTHVRVNNRVRLQNASGLDGTYEIPVSTDETARLRFEAVGPLPDDSVQVEYSPVRTRKARLAVTVDG